MAKQGTKPEGDHGAPNKAAAAGEEVVIRVPVHCDGCARKLRRSLQRLLDGDGEVSVDSAANTVVVRGQKAAGNAAEAVRIVEKRTGRKAVLLSPAPEKLPPPPPAKGTEGTKKDGGKKKGVMDDLPEINMKMVVVLRMNLHCDACCEEIKRRILRIKGVEDAVPHLKSSQMMVKGLFEPATLVGFIHNCTGRKAAIFRAEPLDHPPPPPPPKSPPPATESEAKKPENTGGKTDEQENNAKKEEEGNKAGGGEEDSNKEPNKTEKKPESGGAAAGEEEEEAHGDGDEAAKKEDAGGDEEVVLESNKKGDHLFAAVPLPAGVVAVAPPPPSPETMAAVVDGGVATYYYSYPSSSYYPYYAHAPCTWHQYQCPPPVYPSYSYAYGGGAGMYGYPSFATEAFSEENPNTCTIV
nr:unnamed protein product [Digitaria exilis]